MSKNIFNASVPNLSELCSIVARIDLTEIKDSSAKSHFHWKTMKCRLIIHTMQNHVIACPIFETSDSINIITSVEFYRGETLQNHLKNINMTWSATKPVTADTYKNCLRYSIQFAIAPRWNRVGPYLISGDNFLTLLGTHTIRLNLTVQAGQKNPQSILEIQPVKIDMIDLRIENLPIPREMIAHFMADPEGIIDIASLGTFRVTVLPSLKRGKLLTALKYIPATCPFKNYGELRRHWKNMYGYRLPKTDVGIIYYEIRFPVATGDIFLYPDVCVRSQIIEKRFLGNPEPVLRRFVQDLRETMPFLCGKSLKLACEDDSFKILTPNSTENENEEEETDELPVTPKNTNFRRDFDKTTRLSFSRGKNQVCSQMSSLMSPTPSLIGFVKNSGINKTTNSSSFQNAPKTTSRQPRTVHFSSEIQNHCPNVNDPEDPDPHKYSPNLQASKFTDFDPQLMEMEYFDLNHFSRRSDFPKIQVHPETSTSTKIVPTVKIEMPTIVKCERKSRHFEGMAENSKEQNEKGLPVARTLSQKLSRNLIPKEYNEN